MEAGKYIITDQTDCAIVTAAEWGTRIKPGAKVCMAMVLETQGFNLIEHSCPACNLLYTGAKTHDLARVKWHDPNMFHAAYIKLTSLVKHEMRDLVSDNCGTPD